jgi:hypothetical protein
MMKASTPSGEGILTIAIRCRMKRLVAHLVPAHRLFCTCRRDSGQDLNRPKLRLRAAVCAQHAIEGGVTITAVLAAPR